MTLFTYTDMLAYLGIGAAHPGGIPLTKHMLKDLNINEEHAILDIGCGTGQTTEILATEFMCHVTAIDAHQVMIEKAKKRFHKSKLPIDLRQGWAEKLPFKDNRFDFIISESVLAFTNLPLSLPEIKRVLKPSGFFVCLEMTQEINLTKEESEEIMNVYGFQFVLSEEEWRDHFQKAGFQNIKLIKPEANEDAPAHDHDPSPSLDPTLFTILEKHNELHQKFKQKLGYRIFQCS